MPRKLETIPETPTGLDHHSRKCLICHHPHREAIEFEFLHWHNPGGTKGISKRYDVPKTSIYQHAHATGLYEQRSLNRRVALERLMEYAENVYPSASAIVRAVRAHASLTTKGRWVEPASRVVLTVNRASPGKPPIQIAPPKRPPTVLPRNGRARRRSAS